ncbi:tyrosine-protein phosphatase [Plantactinospora sp. GCM10030261]|uniref:tyrosine-protein phosphatase n=1 Tax=Plantactinospora sp. GCM10030261 TaxID=3273420 RepID=UPI00360C07CE
MTIESAPTTGSFTECFNFRDVGGRTGLDGRLVRTGRLYRSDSLHRLSADWDAFRALGIRTVIDLRRPTEVTRDGRVPHHDGLTYRHIHPEHREWSETPYDDRHDLARYLADRYLDLAETGTAGIGAALGVIADADSAPAVVHCFAGKDRTGVVCALTLSLLGVDEAEIAADYALSTVASQRYTDWARAAQPDAVELPPPFLASPAETMAMFLDGLRHRHGSVEGYVRATGLSAGQIDDLRGHLLD